MVFKPVSFEWEGETYTVPPDRVLGAIAIIEEHVSFNYLAAAVKGQNIPLSKLAVVYGEVLRYAGAPVTNDEVYAGMFSGDLATSIFQALNMLLHMMLPPSVLAKMEDGEAGNPPAPTGRGRNVSSSKRGTKSSSPRAK